MRRRRHRTNNSPKRVICPEIDEQLNEDGTTLKIYIQVFAPTLTLTATTGYIWHNKPVEPTSVVRFLLSKNCVE